MVTVVQQPRRANTFGQFAQGLTTAKQLGMQKESHELNKLKDKAKLIQLHGRMPPGPHRDLLGQVLTSQGYDMSQTRNAPQTRPAAPAPTPAQNMKMAQEYGDEGWQAQILDQQRPNAGLGQGGLGAPPAGPSQRQGPVGGGATGSPQGPPPQRTTTIPTSTQLVERRTSRKNYEKDWEAFNKAGQGERAYMDRRRTVKNASAQIAYNPEFQVYDEPPGQKGIGSGLKYMWRMEENPDWEEFDPVALGIPIPGTKNEYIMAEGGGYKKWYVPKGTVEKIKESIKQFDFDKALWHIMKIDNARMGDMRLPLEVLRSGDLKYYEGWRDDYIDGTAGKKRMFKKLREGMGLPAKDPKPGKEKPVTAARRREIEKAFDVGTTTYDLGELSENEKDLIRQMAKSRNQ